MTYLDQTAPSRSDCWVCDGEGWDWAFDSPCSNCQLPTAEPAGAPTPDDAALHEHPSQSSQEPQGGNTMSNFWADPEVEKAATSGSYHKFNEIGDTVAGTIAGLDKRVFDAGTANERTAVEITLADESKVTCGQVKLMQLLIEMQPQVGDDIEITLADIEKRGSKTLKHWKVTHTNSAGEAFTVDQTA